MIYSEESSNEVPSIEGNLISIALRGPLFSLSIIGYLTYSNISSIPKVFQLLVDFNMVISFNSASIICALIIPLGLTEIFTDVNRVVENSIIGFCSPLTTNSIKHISLILTLPSYMVKSGSFPARIWISISLSDP